MSRETNKLKNIISTMSGMIQDRYKDDQGFGSNYYREAGRVKTAVNALFEVYQAKKPTETDASHYRRVANHATKLKEDLKKAEQRMFETHAKYHDDIESRLQQKLGFTENQYAAELRETLRTSKESKRHQIINDLIREGDGSSLAAIFNAPSAVTGIPKEQREKYKAGYIKTHASDIMAEQENFNNTLSELSTLVGTAHQAAKSLVDADVLADIERGEQQAFQAEEGFKSVLA